MEKLRLQSKASGKDFIATRRVREDLRSYSLVPLSTITNTIYVVANLSSVTFSRCVACARTAAPLIHEPPLTGHCFSCTRLVLAKHNILATLIPIAAGRPKSVLAMAQRQEVSQIKRPKTPDNIKQAVMSVDPIATTRQRRLTAIAFRRIESHVVELRKAVKVRGGGNTCTLL